MQTEQFRPTKRPTEADTDGPTAKKHRATKVVDPPPAAACIPFRLTKVKSTLVNDLACEVIDKDRVNALLRTPRDGKILRIEKIIDADGVEREYHLERQKLVDYRNCFDDNKRAFVVRYGKTPGGFGRMYLEGSVGMTAMRKSIRDTLMSGTHVDFDLSNAHFRILVSMCVNNGIACPHSTRFCDERESIMKQMQTELGVDRKPIKQLLLSYIFGSQFGIWCKKHGIPGKTEPEFSRLLRVELEHIADRIKDANQHMTKLIDDKTASKQKRLDDMQMKATVAANKLALASDADKPGMQKLVKSFNSRMSLLRSKIANYDGCFLSHYLQEVEFRIMEPVIVELKRLGLCDLPSDNSVKTAYCYEYDGVKLLKSNVDRFGGVDAVLQLMNRVAKEGCGVDVKLETKPIESHYDLGEWMTDHAKSTIPVCTSVEKELADDRAEERRAQSRVCAPEDDVETRSFDEVRDEFELTHAKVLSKSMYVQLREGATPIFYTEGQFKTTYSHLAYYEQVTDKKGRTSVIPKNFLRDWMYTNPTQRMFVDIGIYPPGVEVPQGHCPDDNVFINGFLFVHKFEIALEIVSRCAQNECKMHTN